MPPDRAATGLGSRLHVRVVLADRFCPQPVLGLAAFFWLFTSVPMVTLPPIPLANPPQEHYPAPWFCDILYNIQGHSRH